MVCDVDLALPDATRTHTVEVARGFAAEGLDVYLVTRGPDPQIEGVQHAKALAVDRQRVRRLASLNTLTVRLMWAHRRTARRLYVRHRWSLMPVLLIGRLLGYHVVTQVDDIPYGRGYEHPISALSDYGQRISALIMGRLVKGVVAVTPQIKSLLVEQFHVSEARIAVLPNGVDVDYFTPLDRADALRSLELDPELRYVVFSGHFAPWVDFDTMLEAFAIVVAKRPDTRLLLLGDGSERANVDALARRLGIDNEVIVTGFVSDREQVRQFVAAGVVTLSANRLDHRARIGVSPVKLAEYLASARAVVATDLPGLRETLEDTGAGIVVPVEPSAMAAAIVELLDPERADELGARGRRLAEERFAWRSIVGRTMPLFGL